jgi:cobalamin biosynthesis Mg chelatase CobN
MLREKHTVQAFWKQFFVGDIKWSDFLLLYTDYPQALENILTEYNTEKPQLNNRQTKELLDTILEFWYSKQLKAEKGQSKWDAIENLLNIEMQIMQHLHQPLSEIRNRPLKYVMKILGHKKQDDSPDRQSLKKNLGQFYKK